MSDARNIDGAEAAAAVVLEHMSPRAHRIAELERWHDGTQYDGLASWWDEDVSLFKRAPCVVYPIVRAAIDSFGDLVLGEGRFPAATCRPGEDEAEDGGLSEEDGAALDQLLTELQAAARFRRVVREAFAMSMAQRSVAVIWGARETRLFGETVKARWCEPTFAPDGAVASLAIQYPYVEETRDSRGVWRARAAMYRRVIDAERDVTFAPVELQKGVPASALSWTPAVEVTHGLGFCPVVWYPFMKRSSIVGDFDGVAIHEHLFDEIRAHDMALSQRHRAALYAGDPLITEIGVEPGSSPTGTREASAGASSPAGGRASTDNPVNGRYLKQSRGTRTGREKSPGRVWQYENPDTKVTIHTLPGDALDAIDKNAHDIRQKIAESLAVVFMDPENVKFAATVSGKALETLRARQLDRCDQYREDIGDGLILPSLRMLMRLALRQRARLRVPGLAKAAPMLARFEVA